MPAGYEGNRHSRLRGLRHCSQLLLQRVSPAALDSREDFNSINCIRHRRITRLTPSPSLCSYGPVEMGAAPIGSDNSLLNRKNGSRATDDDSFSGQPKAHDPLARHECLPSMPVRLQMGLGFRGRHSSHSSWWVGLRRLWG